MEFRDDLQSQLIEAEQQMFQGSSVLEKRLELSIGAVERRLESIQTLTQTASRSVTDRSGYMYRHYWKRINREAGLA